MKRKPLWGLWLLVVVAPVVPFAMVSSVNYWKNLPSPLDSQASEAAALGTPLIGSVTMIEGSMLDSWSIIIPTCNPTREELVLRIRAITGAKEIIYRDNVVGKPYYPINKPFLDGQFFKNSTVGNEQLAINVCDVKRKRHSRLKLEIHWKLGKDHGVRTIWVTPKMSLYNTGE